MSAQRENRLVRQFFETMPSGARAAFYIGVFCCFAPIGLLREATTLTVEPWWVIALMTLFSGAVAVAYAWTAIHAPRWFPVPVALHIALTVLFAQTIPETVPPTTLGEHDLQLLSNRMAIMAAVITLSLAGAYVSFFILIRREGLRFSGAHTEIRLARNIHEALVPRLSGRQGDMAWLGRSRPSGDVGGDLVDELETPRGWHACVADVSGHGVASGLLMGMFKTAFRAALDDATDVADVATRINRTISPLRQPHMFITAAFIQQTAPGRLAYLLAGHPPMLHYHHATNTSDWVGESQLALALLDDTVYTSDELVLAHGDVLVIVTDGLLEVFDRDDRELGLDGLNRAVTAAARGGSLADIEQAVFTTCEQHGPQLDDQTVLVVTRTAGHAAAT